MKTEQEQSKTPLELFGQGSVGVIGVDEDHVIRYSDTRMQSLCGYTAEELDASPLNLLLPQRIQWEHHGLVEGFAAQHGQSGGREMQGRARTVELISKCDPIEVRAHIDKIGDLRVVAFSRP